MSVVHEVKNCNKPISKGQSVELVQIVRHSRFTCLHQCGQNTGYYPRTWLCLLLGLDSPLIHTGWLSLNACCYDSHDPDFACELLKQTAIVPLIFHILWQQKIAGS